MDFCPCSFFISVNSLIGLKFHTTNVKDKGSSPFLQTKYGVSGEIGRRARL